LATDPSRDRPRKIQAIVLGILAVVFISRGSEKLRGWIDRRFFREAYNAEQILRQLSDRVRTMVETVPLLETVAKQISGSLHVPRVTMLVKDERRYGPAFALGFADPPEVSFETSGGTVGQLQRNREPLRVYFEDPDSWIYREPSVTEPEREQLSKLETQLLLPLAFKEKLVGFMSLSAKRSQEPYSASDVQLLESVATQTGLALENSRLTEVIASEVAQRERLNRELEIAREVQEHLFPRICTALPGLDYAGRCRPARVIGGDYYDFLELADGCLLGIAIGDVSGKGIPAALLMASLQASLRGQTISGPTDLAKLMYNVNRLIFETSPANRYATFFYGQFEPLARRLTYVNGGHNPPMVFRNGEVLRLEDGGPVVGLFKTASYTQSGVILEGGDVLLLYTDGISEAMNASDEEWGEERMIEAVRACQCRPSLEMIDELMCAADGFAAGAPQHDDMTIMVIRVL
jgi:sigma-B regulation protein RsbU (phosphoserine phosphatase)